MPPINPEAAPQRAAFQAEVKTEWLLAHLSNLNAPMTHRTKENLAKIIQAAEALREGKRPAMKDFSSPLEGSELMEHILECARQHGLDNIDLENLRHTLQETRPLFS